MKFEDIKIGESSYLIVEISSAMIEKFASVSGDNNKIHLDEQYARTTLFKRRIAHGFLYGSFISRVIGTDFPGQGTIYLSQNMVFHAPVFINDIIKVVVSVKNILPKNKLILSTNIFNQKNKLVLEGEASVWVP
jgi:3-hydroxybutyryl-CoA dehydratase